VQTFLVECYPLWAASALGKVTPWHSLVRMGSWLTPSGFKAANSFARSSFAAGFPLFGVQMFLRLGDQWASTTLAFIALAMAPFRKSQEVRTAVRSTDSMLAILFFRFGKRLRGRSRFAQSP